MVQLLLNVVYVVLMVVLAIVLYKLLLKRLNRGNVVAGSFCELQAVTTKPAFGEIDFCFTCKENKHVDFEIVSLNFEPIISVVSKEFDAGQHILKFDSTQIENGEYYYQLRTNNQRIFKKIFIDNSKLNN